jgi:hypothetical protein
MAKANTDTAATAAAEQAAAEQAAAVPVKRFVQLAPKNQDGGFSDPDTRFDISRDQVVELTEPIGAATRKLLASGVLVQVEK